ncbi:MAG: MFS transporter [Muribaculaceae bacterium]|nr:MFS transporter [Muribaculaceae bacterium]MDE6558826.1 MFS transporter [Muribaculaceae bacterium]
MLCFFVMGFVDLVGSATNFVKEDLNLSAAQAGFIPSLVFFWFLIFAVPTGILMNRIGRKKTVLFSLILTLVSLIVPIFGSGYYTMLCAFSLLGIGNAVMQTSLNPLVSGLINPARLASTLTFGQFVKALASLLAPYLMAWGAAALIPTLGMGWRVLFPIFAIVCILSIAILGATPIKEERPDKVTGFKECIVLLRIPFVALCFIGIMCHVGIDVGTNTFAPQILINGFGLSVEEAVIGTQIYFYFRTGGCLAGSYILAKMSARKFFAFSVVCMLVGMIGLFVATSQLMVLASIACIGFGNSNVFSVIFAQALNRQPNEKNEVSGLMIMGLFGGTVFPLCMGFAQDAVGIAGAVGVMTLGVLYLCYFISRIKKA